VRTTTHIIIVFALQGPVRVTSVQGDVIGLRVNPGERGLTRVHLLF